MKQKRDDADTELERPFDFTKAKPNPYAGGLPRMNPPSPEAPLEPGVPAAPSGAQAHPPGDSRQD